MFNNSDDRGTRNFKRYLTIAVVVLIILYFIFIPKRSIDYDFIKADTGSAETSDSSESTEIESIRVTYTKASMVKTDETWSFDVKVDDIESAELVDNWDWTDETAVCSSGYAEGKVYCGDWTNSTLGSYELCAYTSHSTVIKITTTDGGIYIYNLDSASTTESNLEAVNEMLANQAE